MNTTGRLTPNTPLQLEMAGTLGPRHYCFHPSQDVVYFSDEQGCSVTGYRLDTAAGTLSAFQTISTLPEGYTERNTCSQIQLTPCGEFSLRGQPGAQQHCRLFGGCRWAVDGRRPESRPRRCPAPSAWTRRGSSSTPPGPRRAVWRRTASMGKRANSRPWRPTALASVPCGC